MALKPQHLWISIERWTQNKLENENIITLMAMCRSKNVPYTHLPGTGRRKPFATLLMDFKRQWIIERQNGNREAQDAAREQENNNNNNNGAVSIPQPSVNEIIGSLGIPQMLNNMDEEESGAPGARNDADDQSDADDHMQERPEEKAPGDANDNENAQGNNAQAPANNQVYQWLHGINMAQYWASFESNGCTFWGAVDSLTDNDLLCMNIIMVGHRRHILRELSKMNAQLSGSAILSGGSGGDAVGLGGAIGARGGVIGARGGVIGARGGAIGAPVSMAALGVSMHGQTFVRIIQTCHGLTLSKTRAKVASTAHKVMFVPLMSKTGADGKKLNSVYQISKSMVFWLCRWELAHVNNYKDPAQVARQIGGGRGGTRYHTGTLILHGLSVAYGALSDDDKNLFKEEVIDKYIQWMTPMHWKKHSIRMGDWAEVQQLNLIDFN